MTKLILASGSPRRKVLLERLGFTIDVVPSGVDETFDASESPDELVIRLARSKARSVADSGRPGDALIIGADTVVVHRGRILGQPEDAKQAHGMLSALSGEKHDVYTGVCLLRIGKDGTRVAERSFAERTAVQFSLLSDEEIVRYVETGSPLDKAGGYGIQDDWGALFVNRIEGDYNTVIGLPLHRLYREMKEIAPDVIQRMKPQTA